MAITDENNRISAGLRADVMRSAMENKELLAAKGSIYVGTGQTVSVGGVAIPKTEALNPPTDLGYDVVLVAGHGANAGTLSWAKYNTEIADYARNLLMDDIEGPAVVLQDDDETTRCISPVRNGYLRSYYYSGRDEYDVFWESADDMSVGAAGYADEAGHATSADSASSADTAGACTGTAANASKINNKTINFEYSGGVLTITYK